MEPESSSIVEEKKSGSVEQGNQGADEAFAMDPTKIAYSHLIHNPKKQFHQVMGFCKQVFDAVRFLQSLSYKIRSLVADKIQPKRLTLGGANANNVEKRTLYIDLDETLIKASTAAQPNLTQTFMLDGLTIWYAVRPYVIPFLQKLASDFELVIYTTAAADYALFFFQLLNQLSGGTISYFLHRQHCINVYKGLFLKPLELVKDRLLTDVLLVDNNALSFGFHLDNGVPVMTWNGESEDAELLFLCNYLLDLNKNPDLVEANRQKLRLRGITTVTKTNVAGTV